MSFIAGIKPCDCGQDETCRLCENPYKPACPGFDAVYEMTVMERARKLMARYPQLPRRQAIWKANGQVVGEWMAELLNECCGMVVVRGDEKGAR